MTSIVIDLDEEEMQQIAAILVENYIETNLLRKQNVHFLKYVKKTAAIVGQFAGITFSLVGANILTKMYDRTTETVSTCTDKMDLNATITNEIDEICNHKYGCDDGLCWRTCNETSELSKTICYMKTISKEFKEKCSSANDCSPCEECNSKCQNTI